MIFYLAIRNLVRNIRINLRILILLAVIVLLFFLGNSILAQTDRGLEKSYTENYTGDLVVQEKSEIPFGLFGANSPSIGEYFSIPVIKNMEQVRSIAEQSGFVDSAISQLSGIAVTDISGDRYWSSLFGVDGRKYTDFFKGIELVEGDFFSSDETGAMMSLSRIERLERERGSRLQIGDPILLTMAGNSGFKIRQVPLTGVFTYTNSSAELDDLLLVDAQTLRALNSITLASPVENSSDNEDLFSSSIDDLFGSGDIEAEEDDTFSVDSVLDMLSASPEAWESELIGGSWNFLMLRLRDGASPSRARKELNRLFGEAGLNAEVVDWRQAAGLSALMVLLLRFLFNGGFLLAVFAGVLAIVNILIISIYERTGEIGTLRAIGSTKGHIGFLLLIEYTVLSFTAGLIAILSGKLIFQIINSLEITLSNTMLQALLGDSVLRISFIPEVALISLGASLLLGGISLIYPVKAALAIEPVTAVAKGQT